jgi:hypothetical protein
MTAADFGLIPSAPNQVFQFPGTLKDVLWPASLYTVFTETLTLLTGAYAGFTDTVVHTLQPYFYDIYFDHPAGIAYDTFKDAMTQTETGAPVIGFYPASTPAFPIQPDTISSYVVSAGGTQLDIAMSNSSSSSFGNPYTAIYSATLSSPLGSTAYADAVTACMVTLATMSIPVHYSDPPGSFSLSALTDLGIGFNGCSELLSDSEISNMVGCAAYGMPLRNHGGIAMPILNPGTLFDWPTLGGAPPAITPGRGLVMCANSNWQLCGRGMVTALSDPGLGYVTAFSDPHTKIYFQGWNVSGSTITPTSIQPVFDFGAQALPKFFATAPTSPSGQQWWVSGTGGVGPANSAAYGQIGFRSALA